MVKPFQNKTAALINALFSMAGREPEEFSISPLKADIPVILH